MSLSVRREAAPIISIDGFSPLLESWEAKTHAAQVRLQRYLDDLEAQLRPATEGRAGLSMHLDVDVQDPARLLRHYDLENYLTPIIRRLGPSRFLRVSGVKRVGGGSLLRVSETVPSTAPTEGWEHAAIDAGAGYQRREWKERIRARLLTTGARAMSPGPVEVGALFTCAPGRNWSLLWKPAGDALGPILGESSGRPFHPDDDRITRIAFHLDERTGMGHDVRIGVWWRPST